MKQPQGNPGENSPETQQAYRDLRQMSVLDGIPNESLWRAVVLGGVSRQVFERDVFVADPQDVAAPELGPRVMLVASGQVAVAVFEPAKIAERKQAQVEFSQMTEAERNDLSALLPPPLSRVARKNLATFMRGDLFNSAALVAGSRGDVAFYAVEPSVVVSLSHELASELAVQFPFFEDRLRLAIQVGRDRLYNILGVKQEILDFFIRHGISVSGEMVRVRQLDTCIDCKQCEEACEERYGARRLTLGGYQLGMLDFVFSCRTCTDQRCITPCEYDSIRFAPNIREVVINETSCVGCTLCAQSCPFEAIEMVDISDPGNPTYREEFKLRLDGDGSLNFGPGKGRVARARRIANKCDHCYEYSTQACVSACPTGSLIEVSAYELFQERSPEAQAATGMLQDMGTTFGHREILPVEPFTEGIGVRDAGMAKTKRGRLAPVLMWGLSLTAFFLATAEIILRMYKPTSSLQYFLLRAKGLEPVIAEMKVGFRAGTDLAVNCGYVGTGLMLLAILYVPLRRAKSFRKIASNTMWFDFHLMSGTMGPAFILLHTGFKLDNWVSAAFWSMVIVFISGVIGRYLYTQVPDLLSGRELEELDHQRAMRSLRAEFPHAVAESDAILEPHKQVAESIAANAGMLRSFLWVMLEDLRRPSRWLQRKRTFSGANISKASGVELARRTGRMMLINRRKVLASRAQLLLHSWKKVHVPFSMIMAAISVFHIYLVFTKSL
ncbi:MAG: 4Fe-4S dicluster domain-containing protein [Myxococcales bacterium]|nr:4Fe-4S dicluster domain-containing protein [Myxococcales bacterium]